jgi:hypothetical protein
MMAGKPFALAKGIDATPDPKRIVTNNALKLQWLGEPRRRICQKILGSEPDQL